MPTARYDAGAAVFNDKIFVVGGSLNSAFVEEHTGVVEVYTPFGYSEEPLTTAVSEESSLIILTTAIIAGAAIATAVIMVTLYSKHVRAKP
jgi:hypothetical protein